VVCTVETLGSRASSVHRRVRIVETSVRRASCTQERAAASVPHTARTRAKTCATHMRHTGFGDTRPAGHGLCRRSNDRTYKEHTARRSGAAGHTRPYSRTSQRTSEERTSEERTREERTSEERTSEERTSEERTSEQRTSEERTSEERTSEERTSEERTSEERASEQRTSEQPQQQSERSRPPTQRACKGGGLVACAAPARRRAMISSTAPPRPCRPCVCVCVCVFVCVCVCV
jgi:cobalamin biosynthesis Mg chelatase CobN